jgi:hypothetical protein
MGRGVGCVVRNDGQHRPFVRPWRLAVRERYIDTFLIRFSSSFPYSALHTKTLHARQLKINRHHETCPGRGS